MVLIEVLVVVVVAVAGSSQHSDDAGANGRLLHSQIESGLRKRQESPPAKQNKPLPAPDETPKTRRAGRKVCSSKETQMRKAPNRL